MGFIPRDNMISTEGNMILTEGAQRPSVNMILAEVNIILTEEKNHNQSRPEITCLFHDSNFSLGSTQGIILIFKEMVEETSKTLHCYLKLQLSTSISVYLAEPSMMFAAKRKKLTKFLHLCKPKWRRRTQAVLLICGRTHR